MKVTFEFSSRNVSQPSYDSLVHTTPTTKTMPNGRRRDIVCAQSDIRETKSLWSMFNLLYNALIVIKL